MVSPYLFSSMSFTTSMTEEVIWLLESIFLLLKVVVVASLPSQNIFKFFSVNCLRLGLFSAHYWSDSHDKPVTVIVTNFIHKILWIIYYGIQSQCIFFYLIIVLLETNFQVSKIRSLLRHLNLKKNLKNCAKIVSLVHHGFKKRTCLRLIIFACVIKCDFMGGQCGWIKGNEWNAALECGQSH